MEGSIGIAGSIESTQIEVGQYWKAENGTVVEVTGIDSRGDFILKTIMKDSISAYHVNRYGIYSYDTDFKIFGYDLKCLISEEENPEYFL